MKTKSWIPLFTLGLFFCGSVFGQTSVESARYSMSRINGSARNVALAGANTALGAEMSSLHFNPAGIGMFFKQEVSGSGGLTIRGVNTNHYGIENYNSEPRLSIDNLSYVSPFASGTGNWKSINFGISYTRTSNFDEQFRIEGPNPESSLTDAFVNLISINGVPKPDVNPIDYPYSVDLAWQTYLLDVDSFGNYTTPISQYGQRQVKEVSREGETSEISLGLSANYQHKLYLGASLNITTLNFTERAIYSEEPNPNDTAATLNYFDFEEILITDGNGFNLKVGAIYRLADFVRVGASIHTPTLYSLSDEWGAFMTTSTNTYGEVFYESPIGFFEYRLVTPWKISTGATFTFNKAAMLSVDYERIDFRSSRFSNRRNSNYDLSFVNSRIANDLMVGNNIKVGGEYRINRFFIRGGYAYLQNPISNNFSLNLEQRVTSFGIGYRSDRYYFDLTYQGIDWPTEEYYLYTPDPENGLNLAPTEINRDDFRLMVTVGFRN